jgi:hypothetical protein
MTTAIVVLVLVAAVVALSIVRPGSPAEFPAGAPADRDAERQLTELRAIAGHRPDHSAWKAVSRAASASTCGAAPASSGWNGSHRTSPST